MKQHAERRRSPRYEIQQMVQVSGVREEFIHAASVNISEHGLSCVSADKVEPDGILLLMLVLDNYRTINVESVVVWEKKHKAGYEVGLEFTNISDKDAKALRTFLAK